jgi:hypothetical protein
VTPFFFFFNVGFIREIGKATAREVQQSLEAGSSGKRYFLNELDLKSVYPVDCATIPLYCATVSQFSI